MFRAIIVLFLVTVAVCCNSQDFIFTQNHPGILYQNPGFAGIETDPTIRTTYQSNLAYSMLYGSFDAYSYKLHGGLGVYVGQRWSNAVSGIFSSAGAIYSPSFRISDSTFFKPSLQYGISNYFSEYTGSPLPHSNYQDNYSWGSLGAGLSFIHKNSFAGIVLHNVNQPLPGNGYGKIPMDIIVSAGTLINITKNTNASKKILLMPSIFYGIQSDYWYYNAGAEYRKSAFLCGLRVINYSSDGMYYDKFVDYLCAELGLRFNRLRLVYSHDFSFNNSNDSQNEFTLCISFARTNVKGKNSGLYNMLL
ncbi:MAG: hypothetical protein V1904_15205 [Bacteroidota bacterium]